MNFYAAAVTASGDFASLGVPLKAHQPEHLFLSPSSVVYMYAEHCTTVHLLYVINYYILVITLVTITLNIFELYLI